MTGEKASLIKRIQKDADHLMDAWESARLGLNEKSVHDLRVAGRRLESSLALLNAARADNFTKPLRCRVKKLVKRFGPLRDLQVHLSIHKKAHRSSVPAAFKTHLSEHLKKEKKAAGRLLTRKRKARLRSRVRKMQSRAERNLEAVDRAIVRSRIRNLLQKQRAKFQRARKAMTVSDPDKLHAARISAKKLRYSLEAANGVLNLRAQSEIERLHREQNRLGRLHDLQIAKKRYAEWKSAFADAA